VAPTKRALLIGISKYPKKPLNTEVDLALLSNALIRHHFPASQIKQIKDEQCTNKGIVGAIRAHLIAPAQPGDILVLHYSGHGKQLKDDNGDEPDQKDEAIVPYDTLAPLRDDEIGKLLLEMRKKVGPQGHVLFTFDACHSGTVVRDEDKPDLPASRFYPSDEALSKATDPNEFTGYASETGLGAIVDTKIPKESELGTVVILTAARSDDEASQHTENGQKGGLFSYALSRALLYAGKSITYSTLFERAASWAKSQKLCSPQIEGHRDLLLFSGQAVDQAHYAKIAGRWENREVTLNAGGLLGFWPGCEVGFYPDSTFSPEPSKRLAKGQVIRDDGLNCTVKLNQGEREPGSNVRVFVEKRDWSARLLRVMVTSTSAQKEEIAQFLRGSEAKGIRENPQYPDVRVSYVQGTLKAEYLANKGVSGGGASAGGNSDFFLVYCKEGVSPSSLPQALEKMREEIVDLNKARHLLGFQNEAPGATSPLKFRLVLETCTVSNNAINPNSRKEIDLEAVKKKNGGRLVVPAGTRFTFKVINQGQTAGVFNVINIDSDYKIQLLAPFNNDMNKPNILKPGGVWEAKDMPFDFMQSKRGQSGRETFLIIGTQGTELDLSALATLRGRNRSTTHPIEDWMDDLYKDQFIERGAPGLPSGVFFDRLDVDVIPNK
jgi:hypothetical protein